MVILIRNLVVRGNAIDKGEVLVKVGIRIFFRIWFIIIKKGEVVVLYFDDN